VKFYAISIQNEVNFEEFYNSATYPLSSQYITALKAARREFDKYEDLKEIQIIGPEDLLGGDVWGMWQYGGGDGTVHKNLQYLVNIAADPEAARALGFFCIHGYASDGATAAGADSQMWDWWVNGWRNSPNPAIPADVKGFAAYGKKSWMTETSGEEAAWLAPRNAFAGNGGWSIALKTQQALTAGRESACIYWQFAERENETTGSCLTRKNNGDREPKYVAAKHFFRYIRPNAVAVRATVDGDGGVTASAYVHEQDKTLTVVLVSRAAESLMTTLNVPAGFAEAKSFQTFTSSADSLWKESAAVADGGTVAVEVPGYGVVTLVAKVGP
jgi:O-glycosyl hydrolase